MPRVTALRELPRGRVALELDGNAWRTLPARAVAAAGIRAGLELERAHVRALAREVRRAKAVATAERALRFRDHSRASLEQRLVAADVAPVAREAALAALERTGLVDDARAAEARARSLCERGYGDVAIRVDLERRGFAGDAADRALASLPAELDRARDAVSRSGVAPTTQRRLAARGFSPETLEAVFDGVAEDDGRAIG